MRDDPVQILLSDPRQGEKTVVDRELDLTHDVKPVPEKEIVISMDRTSERVFNRENRSVSDPELHRLKRDLKLITRNGLAVRISFTGGGFRVRAGNTLVGDA